MTIAEAFRQFTMNPNSGNLAIYLAMTPEMEVHKLRLKTKEGGTIEYTRAPAKKKRKESQ